MIGTLRVRALALTLMAAVVSGCAALTPTAEPEPTELAPAVGTQVEVAVDNLSDEPLALTLSQMGALGPHLILGACEATNLVYPQDGPFTVGLGAAADFRDAPMPPLVDSTDLQRVDGGYRLLVRINAAGNVIHGPLVGEAPLRGAGEC